MLEEIKEKLLMENFNYYNPTRIVNGRDKHLDIAKILKEDNIDSVLLVYGMQSIKKSGLYSELMELLKKEEIHVVEHGGVRSNPVLSHAREGVRLAKEAGVKAILAVGGGSVIDESKAIAAGFEMEQDLWDLFTGYKAKSALPLYTILTISATGSEMNSGAVLTNEDTLEKFSFSSPYTFPRVSVVNPAFTFSLPSNYMAYSAVDAITHALEVYFTAVSMPLIKRRFIENVVVTVMETTERIIEQPEDYDARAEFSLAATWALNGLTTIGVGKYSFPNHMIEHSLSALYDVPHGAGLAVVLPAWMKWYKEENLDVFERFADKVFGLNTADEGILALEEWFKKIGAPIRLEEFELDRLSLTDLAENAYLTSVRWGLKDNYPEAVIEDILSLA